MPTPFRDFIPAGEDTGAQGNGFRDFVPPSESAPTVTASENPTTEASVTVKSKKELVAEAKALGIDTKGMNKDDIQKAIDEKNAEVPETPEAPVDEQVIEESTEEPVTPVEE